MQSRSEREEQRRERRNRIIVSVVLAFLMISSTIGFYFTGSGGSTTRHNGYKIRAVMNEFGQAIGYTAKLDGRDIAFASLPTDSSSITVPPGMFDQLRSAPVIAILFDPNDPSVIIYDRLRFDLQQNIPKQYLGAVTNASDTYQLPILTCADAAPQGPIILLTQGNRTITYKEGCWVLAGRDVVDWQLLRDRVVYGYYGVTEE